LKEDDEDHSFMRKTEFRLSSYSQKIQWKKEGQSVKC
jgi:hypothetical protein